MKLIAINKITKEIKEVDNVQLTQTDIHYLFFTDGKCVPHDEWDVYLRISN
jgi:hypothetical protein